MFVFELDQGLGKLLVEFEVKVIDCPAQTAVGPEITGSGKISNASVTIVEPHSLVTVKVMVFGPVEL